VNSNLWSGLIGALIGAGAALSAQALAEILKRQREEKSALRVMKYQAQAVVDICAGLPWGSGGFQWKVKVLTASLA
jgi:hypothetical protein